MRRKGPGFFARMYGTGCTSFLEIAKGYRIRTPQPASKMGTYTLSSATSEEIKRLMVEFDFAEIEARVLARMDFAEAAGRTLAAVNADPRNHFGKYALRRFEND